MKSKELWDFTQKYAANKMINLGALLALTGMIGFYFNFEIITGTLISLTLITLIIMALYVRTEKL